MQQVAVSWDWERPIADITMAAALDQGEVWLSVNTPGGQDCRAHRCRFAFTSPVSSEESPWTDSQGSRQNLLAPFCGRFGPTDHVGWDQCK